MASNNLSMAGLAVRAGKAVFGSAACEKGIRHNKIRLLLLQEGLSSSSKRNFEEMCSRFGICTLTVNEQTRLGDAVGKPGIMVLGITDKRFADAIRNLMDGGRSKE